MTAKIWARTMIQVNVMVNYRCNCHCRICDYWREPFSSRPDMTLKTGCLLAQKLHKIAPLAMCLVGGEPLLNPNLLDIAGPLAQDHFLDLVTNGSMVTKEMARALFQTGFSEIGVSIDYDNPQDHDAQRGYQGLWDKALNALELLVANRVTAAQRVRLMTVVMEDNLDQIEPLSVICQKLGVKHNLTLCVCGRGQAQAKAPRDLLKTVRLLKEIQARRPELLILPGFLEGFVGRDNRNCHNGHHLMAIDSEGRFLRCLDRQENPVGSLVDTDLDQLLLHLKKQYQSEPCDECWTSCRGIVEPLLYGPKRLQNMFYYLKATKAQSLLNSTK